MSLHVAFCTDAEIVAGAEIAASVLLSHLDPAVQVTVVGTDEAVVAALTSSRPGTRRRMIPRVRTKAELRGAPAVRNVLADLRPDVVHLNKSDVAGLRYVETIAWSLPRLGMVSVVHHVERPGSATARWLSRRLARREHAIVAVGDSLARELEAILGLPERAVRSIPNAIPPVADEPVRRSPHFTIGTLTRLVPHKRIDLVLMAMADLPDARLVVGGDGPERQRLGELARTLLVADRVEFPGWVAPAAVLDRCDVLVSAADVEGRPMAVLEAQRRRLPIVATAVGALPEMISDGVDGLLVPPGDPGALGAALRRLDRDRVFAERLGRAGAARQEQGWAPADMAGAYEALYRSAAHRTTPRGRSRGRR